MLVLAMQLSTIRRRRSRRRPGGRRARDALEPEPPRGTRDTRTPGFGVRVPAFPQSGTEDGPPTTERSGRRLNLRPDRSTMDGRLVINWVSPCRHRRMSMMTDTDDSLERR